MKQFTLSIAAAALCCALITGPGNTQSRNKNSGQRAGFTISSKVKGDQRSGNRIMPYIEQDKVVSGQGVNASRSEMPTNVAARKNGAKYGSGSFFDGLGDRNASSTTGRTDSKRGTKTRAASQSSKMGSFVVFRGQKEKKGKPE